MRALLAVAFAGMASAATAAELPAQWTPAYPALGFRQPLFLAAAPGDAGHVFVVTQPGLIYRFDNRPSIDSAPVFLDLRKRIEAGGEMGLLGLAFDPDYAKNGYLYLNYNPKTWGSRKTAIARFTARAGVADPGSEKVLLSYDQPYPNHKGGMLAFGPDRMLYIAAGDGGSHDDPHGNGQNLGTLLGKILRIRPDGTAPADNPFANRAGARAEIWAYGLRNPWRFSFDRATGALWVADVGQNKWEEIDVVTKGGNYGWNVFEGLVEDVNPQHRSASDFRAPIHVYGHDVGCSITGGYVYRGKALPELAGRYIYGDYCSGRIWALTYEKGRVTSNVEFGRVPDLTSFGEDADGELYLTSYDGKIYRMARR